LNVKLSVVLPLFNAQATVRSLLSELIEILPELSPQFEIVLVDDGSTDATAEALKELVIDYPQMRFARHVLHRGTIAAMHTGLASVAGHYVLFFDEGCSASVDDIQKLWRVAPGHDAVIGHIGPLPPSGWFRSLSRSNAVHRAPCAMMLVRRSVALQWSRGAARETLIEWVGRKKLAIERVEVRAARPFGSQRAVDALAAYHTALATSLRVDSQATPRDVLGARKGPNFLSTVKAFASGE
jgi:glycosyltransferase involved in cell wall biosynthesis